MSEIVEPCLIPHYPVNDVNIPVNLYEGKGTFIGSNITFEADVKIFFTWSPSPEVRFESVNALNAVGLHSGECSLILADGTKLNRVFVTSSHFGTTEGRLLSTFAGSIHQSKDCSEASDTKYAMFFLPNFKQPHGRYISYPNSSRRAFRTVLRVDEWTITLDNIENYENSLEYLRNNSTTAVTQVGKLEKQDGSSFTQSQAITCLEYLSWYAVFASGRWTGFCLSCGFNASGERLWESWDTSRTSPYLERTNWLDYFQRADFEALFPSFCAVMSQDAWKEVVHLAVHWYVEANSLAGSIDGSIILTQTAFELLSAAVLADHEGWISQRGYDDLSAADRIRLLFLWAGVPTGIPAGLEELIKLAKAFDDFSLNKIPDAAASMTIFRNTIAHPTQKNRKRAAKYSFAAKIDAWTLGLRNLELCLLRIFGHQGKYSDRISRSFQGMVQNVPWPK